MVTKPTATRDLSQLADRYDLDQAVKRGYKKALAVMFNIVRNDPYDPNPPEHKYERLKGNLKSVHTRRLDYTNRFAYEVLANIENEKDPKTGEVFDGIVKVINMWGHYPVKW